MATLRVPTPTGFNFRSTVRSHGWAQLSPFVLREDSSRLERVQRLQGGTVLSLAVEPGATGELVVEVDRRRADLSPAHRKELTEGIRRIFQLDVDLSEFYALARSTDRYRWVEQAGAGRLLRSPTVWEDLAKTLLTTNTSWGATRGMVRRLTDLGAPRVGGHAPFPTPEQVAALTPEQLATHVRCGYRAEYLHALAAGVAAGEWSVESWDDPSWETGELYDRIRSLKGFGPYAAGTLLKLLGHYDELALDSATRSMVAQVYFEGEAVDDSRIREHYEPYGRWRGLLLWMDLVRHHS